MNIDQILEQKFPNWEALPDEKQKLIRDAVIKGIFTIVGHFPVRRKLPVKQQEFTRDEVHKLLETQRYECLRAIRFTASDAFNKSLTAAQRNEFERAILFDAQAEF